MFGCFARTTAFFLMARDELPRAGGRDTRFGIVRCDNHFGASADRQADTTAIATGAGGVKGNTEKSKRVAQDVVILENGRYELIMNLLTAVELGNCRVAGMTKRQNDEMGKVNC